MISAVYAADLDLALWRKLPRSKLAFRVGIEELLIRGASEWSRCREQIIDELDDLLYEERRDAD